MNRVVLLLIIFTTLSSTEDCLSCTNSGKRWCTDTNWKTKCHTGEENCLCLSDITIPVNCPVAPKASYKYNESFAKYVATPLIAAVYVDDPTPCLRSKLSTAILYRNLYVQCHDGESNSTCHAYIAYDERSKAIIVVFEGTNGRQQWIDELSSFFVTKEPFFDSGRVYAYFSHAFYYLWNGGLQSAVLDLKSRYPNYQLWALGHSLGASICSVFASHVVKTGVYKPEKVKLVTFGQPRTGDMDFALWHDKTFLYSYRVVHKQDPVPHVPPMIGADNVFHHRYEVWYNNDMKDGDPYSLCEEADGKYCSNTQSDAVWQDHLSYFDKDITNTWPKAGCPDLNT